MDAPEPKRPQIQLDPPRVFCATHGEPYRRMWPKGYAVFTLRMFQTVIESEDFAIECRLIDDQLSVETELPKLDIRGPDDDAPLIEANTEEYRAICEALTRRPLCCRVKSINPTRLVEIYTESDIGLTARCARCRLVALGTPYMYKNHWGRTKRWPHICFACIANHLDFNHA